MAAKAGKKDSSSLLRVVVISLGGLSISFALLFVAQFVTDPKFAWLKLLVESIATTVLVAASVGLLFERQTQSELLNMMEETKETISQQIRTLRALDELGLIDAYSDVNAYSFSPLILESIEFAAVMNDGKSWVGRNAGDLRKRLLIPNLKTTFILQHPEPKMLDILADKVQQSPDFIRQKIADTVRELNSFERAESHTLTILGHHHFNVHSLFITEEYIAHTPYLITPGRNTTPVFVFERRGLSSQYQRWYDDVQQLIKLSVPLDNKLHLAVESKPNPVIEDVAQTT